MSMVEFVISHEPRLTIELEITRGNEFAHESGSCFKSPKSVQLKKNMNVTLKE